METYNSHLSAIVRSITKKQITPAERKALLQNFAHQISDLRENTENWSSLQRVSNYNLSFVFYLLGNSYDALNLLEDVFRSEATQVLGLSSTTPLTKVHHAICSSIVSNFNTIDFVDYNYQLLECVWLASLIYIKLEYNKKSKKLLTILTGLPDKFHQYNNSNTYYLLAIISYIQFDIPESLQHLNKCISIKEDFWPAKYLKGFLLLLQDKYSESILSLEDCSQYQRYRVSDSLNLIAINHSKLGKLWSALQKFSESIANNASAVLPLWNASIQYQMLGKPDSQYHLLDSLSKVIKHIDTSFIEPSTPYSTLIIHSGTHKLSTSTTEPFSYLDILYAMARISLKQGNYSKSYSIYKTIYQSMSDPSQSYLRSFSVSPSQFFHEFIYVMMQCQDYDSAWNLCKKLIAFQENDHVLLLFMADIVVNLDKLPIENAIQFLTKLVKHIENLDYQTFHSQTINGINLLNELENRKKLKIHVHNNLAVLLMCIRKYEDAIENIKLALQLDEGNLQTVYNYTLLLWKLGKQQTASQIWLKYRDIPMDQKSLYYEDLLQKKLLQSSIVVPTAHVMNKLSEATVNMLDRSVIQFWLRNLHLPKQ